MSILFAGTPAFAASHLDALIDAGFDISAVITQPDKPGKRGKKPLPSDVKVIATGRGLPVLQPKRLRASDLAGLDPELLIVVAYGQILRTDVLTLPVHGCINVHASLLPRWRGAAPIQRALLAGDSVTGVCTMKMDEGLDTGDVYRRVEVEIQADDTTGSLTQKLADAGTGALIQTIRDIQQGSATATPQPDAGVTYAHKVDKEEAGIDWRSDARTVDRQIRAFNPDPVAFTFLGELRVKIWEASLVDDSAADAAPGEIISASKRGIEIACGDGSINVTRLQLPVGKGTIMRAADVLNARRDEFAPGCRFE